MILDIINDIHYVVKSIQATFKEDEKVKYLTNEMGKSLIKKYIEIRKENKRFKGLQ